MGARAMGVRGPKLDGPLGTRRATVDAAKLAPMTSRHLRSDEGPENRAEAS